MQTELTIQNRHLLEHGLHNVRASGRAGCESEPGALVVSAIVVSERAFE